MFTSVQTDVRVTITRPSDSSGEKYITLTFQDDRSGVVVLKANMGLADFAEALTGLGHVRASAVAYQGVPVIGRYKVSLTQRVEVLEREGDPWRSREYYESWLLQNWPQLPKPDGSCR